MKFPPASDIHRIRKSLDVTQVELSNASGISQSTIAKIEAGKISASYDTVVKLFETLDMIKHRERKDLTAADVCSKEVVAIQSTDLVHQASDLMRSTGYSQLPVMNGEMPVGSISERIIMELLRSGTTMDELAMAPVHRVMGGSYPVVADTTSISLVTTLMGDWNAVLVSRKGKIIGMITNADLLKLV
jgi:predicted transcriptional regulator